MLIFDKPSLDCGGCLDDLNCKCLCHVEDLINCKHYEVHRDDTVLYKVKPVVDLDHFRD